MIRRLIDTDAVPRPRRLALLCAALCAAAFLLAGAADADAAVHWRLTPISDSTVAPGDQLTYSLMFTNDGDANTDGSPVKLTAILPTGVTGSSADTSAFASSGQQFDCPAVAGATVIECEGTPYLPARRFLGGFTITVAVDPGASGVLTTAFSLEGGGASETAHAVDPVTVTAAASVFGLDAFDLALADPTGAAFTAAAGHPAALSTSLDFNLHTNPSPLIGINDPVEDARDVSVDLPAGLFGNPALLDQCKLVDLVRGESNPTPFCSISSQVGTALVRIGIGALVPVPLFNMAPPPGAPARFGFNVNGSVVILDVHPRADGDYGLTTTAANIPQGLAIAGNDIRFWGVPFASLHEPERSCPGSKAPAQEGVFCGIEGATPAAFFRMPTSCAAAGIGLPVSASLDSWQQPGVFKGKSIRTHEPLGYPYPEEEGPAGNMHRVWGSEAGMEGCDEVPFEPTLATALTTDRADSPTGLTVDFGLPSDCWDPKATAAAAEDSVCQSDIRETSVTLPQGLSLNPAAAGGRASCTPAQIGLSTGVGSSPIHFDEAPASCPDAAKIGTVEIETPLLGLHDKDGKPITDEAGRPVLDPLKGSVYLAQQSQNPFGSLLAMYLVAEGNGVIVKQAGEISLTDSGQVTTTFDQVPQTPVSKIHVELFGGPAAALRTPAACGTYTATAELTPWSGTGAVQRQSSFGVTQDCGGGFDPKLDAGTENALAGSFSPFSLRLTREDASQELGGLQITLPPGLIGAPKGIPYCPDSVLASFPANTIPGTGAGEIAGPKCPAASRLGTVTVGAGAGPNPFYTSAGKAFLAGPYKGAPLSLAVIAPAVAGPFDLGTVLVRNALRVDPETTQITAVSDPLPTIVQGIPLDLRDVRVDLDRPNFTLNPTSCEPMSIASTITSTQGVTANPSSYFQAAGCDRLKFKPKLTLRLKGGVKRSKHPALTAILTPRKGDANIGRVQVSLPRAEFLAQSHIRTICTRVQFAAGGGGGAECPKGSVYGKATAISPLVDYPLTGNVYLRSSSNPLPDMVLALNGPPAQPLQIAAVGRIDSSDNGGIRTTFGAVPDAPLSKVVLKLPGGKKSLLENSRNLCQAPVRATVQMDAQNGKLADSKPKLRVDCPKKRGKAGKGSSGRR